jgi:hypothetical protein
METSVISENFFVKEFCRIICVELGTGKKADVIRIWRLGFSLLAVLKFWALGLYILVGRSPVTVSDAARCHNSEGHSLNLASFTVFAFHLILLAGIT